LHERMILVDSARKKKEELERASILRERSQK